VGAIAVWAIVAALTDPRDPLTMRWSGPRSSDGIRDGTLTDAAIKTLIRLAFSFVVAVVFGTALGLALALNGFARRAIRPIVVALQITPFVAWVPLAVIWFGATERAVVFVAIVGSFPSMTLATLQAIRQVPPLYERAGRTLGHVDGRCTARSSCRRRCPA
jgi:NitT/TauT family transport system permease protein